jgi:hypothetical protein
MTTDTTAVAECTPAQRVTRSLLGYGVIAGPFYVTVSLAQALTRDGFDLSRHAWSLLANGSLGWIQVLNFALSGAMVLAFAVGLRRALSPGRGSTWAPRLVAGYGTGLLLASIFRADPGLGFPPGTPADAHDVSWHGMLHLVCASIGFLCLIAACLVVGRRFAADNRPGWALYSRVSGICFLAGFVGVAAGAGSRPLTIAFVVSVVIVWTWMSLVSVHLYRITAK